jgi:Holliday junction resolvase RusA-like endonuclease
MINLKLDTHPKPREKEVYMEEGIVTNILSDEYQQDLRDMAIISIENTTGDFPVKGDVSIIINFYTCRNLNIQGLVKNVLDALNGTVITDDDRVNSLLAKIKPSGGPEYEKTTIDVVTSKPILSLDKTREDFKDYKVLTIEVDAVLEDRFLPYPKTMNVSSVVGVNTQTDEEISELVTNQYDGEIINSEVEVAAVFHIGPDDKGDIDNYSMNYLNNLKGIVVEDIRQIQTLLLNKVNTDIDTLSVNIDIKEKDYKYI